MKTHFTKRKSSIVKSLLAYVVLMGVTVTTQAQVLIDEGFATATDQTPPTDWTNTDLSSSGVLWYFNDPGGWDLSNVPPDDANCIFSDPYAILDSDYDCGDDDDAALETPAFDASVAGIYQLEFDHFFLYYEYEIGQVEVWDGTAWTAVMSITEEDIFGNHETIDITAATGGSTTAKVRFHYFDGICAFFWAIDNVKITRLPPITCPAPTTPTVTAITTTTATLGWTESGSATQWQIKYGAPGFNPATAGTPVIANSNPYVLNPPLTALTSYSFYVRAICAPGDTSTWSVIKNFTTLCDAPALLTTKDSSRCGPGDIHLQATADPGASINWYANAIGGSPLFTGNDYLVTGLSATTTFYAAAATPSTGAGVIRITEMGLGGPDVLEIQNVGSLPIDVTGWKVAISDDYGDITVVNEDIQTLNGTMAPGDIKTWSDESSSADYWGSNIFWNPGAASDYTGWALILDNNDNLIDFVAYNWAESTIQATTLNIGAASVNLTTAWTGDPLDADANESDLGSGYNFQRIGDADMDMASDFNVATASIGSTNTGLTMPFSGTGSCESARVAVIATIKTVPEVNLGNDTTLCPGVSLPLNAANPGSTYTWSNNASTQTISVNTAGNYSVMITAANGCTATDDIEITTGIMPVNNLAATTNLCEGETATLNAGNSGSSFLWSPGGETTQTISATVAANYSVTIESPDGCSITSNSNLIIRPLPVVNLGNDTSICSNAQITLNAGNPGHTYLWNTNANTQTISASDSGTYSVVVTSPYNCVASDDRHIAYLPAPYVEGFNFIPLFYEELGKVRFSPLNPDNVYSYEWDFGDGSPVSNQMNPEHSYPSGGNYTVTLKVFNGCGDFEISLPINVDLSTGIVKLNGNDAHVALYPNPSKEYLIIDNKSDDLKMEQVTVFNTLGAVVYKHQADNSKVHKFNVSSFASGVYSVRILTDKGFVIRKFEVLK